MMKLGKYKFVNEDEVLKHLSEIQDFKGELPWVLFDYIDIPKYFSNVSDSVIKGFYDRKHDVQIVANPLEYIEYDLKVWVEENHKFKNIYIDSHENNEW